MTTLFGALRPRKVWTAARVDNLAGETLTALTKLGQAFERRQVQVGDDVVAWGQYLDANHFSASQWGFYGTSAALQTLAGRARARGEAPSADSLIARCLTLPEEREIHDEVFAEKAEKQDFENVIKLAFVADALHLDHEESVPDHATPALVDDLIGLAVSGERWSTRLPGDPDRESKDQDFATAFIVSVLRRYERFRQSSLWARSRTWLANRVLQDGSFREQRTLVALTGLALLPHRADPHDAPARVKEAVDRCEEELLGWVREQTAIVLNRPVFNGFSIGTRNDYVFLHPELLTALFLLRRANPPRGRRFVLEVLDDLWKNVDRHDGFMGQDGMVTSVDQLWAARLVSEFHRIRRERDGVDRLLPRLDAYVVPRGRARLVWIVALLALALALSILVSGWAGVAVFGVGVAFLLVEYLFERR